MRLFAALVAAAVLVAPCAAPARTVDTVWTDAAAQLFAAQMRKKGAASPQLPEVRAFDADGRPLLRLAPAGNATVGLLNRALARPTPIEGESLDEALRPFVIRGGGGPVRPAVGSPRLVVIDYWATWCAPCKVVSAALDRWLAEQPAGSVTLIRAETDFLAAMRGR